MKAVKTIVAVMSALIVAGLGLVAYGMMTKASKVTVQSSSSPANPSPANPSPVAQSLGAIGLGQPEGSRIVDMTTSDGLLVLRIDGGTMPERVVVVDLRKGKVMGTVSLGAVP